MLEFKHSAEGDDSKSTSRNKWHPIPDQDSCIRSFAQYAGWGHTPILRRLCTCGATWPTSCLARISALLDGGRIMTFSSIMDIPQSRRPTLSWTSAYILGRWWRVPRMVKSLFLTLQFGRLIHSGTKGRQFRCTLPETTTGAVFHSCAYLFTAICSVVVITYSSLRADKWCSSWASPKELNYTSFASYLY